MTWKQTFYLGMISTSFSSLACIIYAKIYNHAFYVDFGQVAGTSNFIAASVIGCLLMALFYRLMFQWKGDKIMGWPHIIYSVFSFASIIGVLAYNLPLEIESPEMFPGLVIPMHFFPALSFFSFLPFFKVKKGQPSDAL